jgi:hypothetical protein
MIVSAFSRARFLLETNFGRRAGWHIELDGDRIGTLSDCRWVDMFWDSYVVGALDGVDTSALTSATNWNEGRFHFRNRRSDDVVMGAFCGGGASFPPGRRVLMRALHLRPASLVESLLVGLASVARLPWRR